MKKQEILKLQRLATAIGHFIRYWGFRKIHGEIWSVLYLTKEPLSGIEICALLKVSKALVSPAMKELEAEGLIRQTQSENSKTKRFVAEDDVSKVIYGVLKRREKPMLESIQQHFSDIAIEDSQESRINPERLQKMGTMIQMAQMGLNAILTESILGE